MTTDTHAITIHGTIGPFTLEARYDSTAIALSPCVVILMTDAQQVSAVCTVAEVLELSEALARLVRLSRAVAQSRGPA